MVEGVGGVGGCTMCVGNSSTGEGMGGVRGGPVGKEHVVEEVWRVEEGEVVVDGSIELEAWRFFFSTSGMKHCRMEDPLLPIETFL